MFFSKKTAGMDPGSRFFSTFVIFVFHGPWIMHWVIWNILIVKAITPSILVRFSKFLCLNTSAFQDLSFSFTAHPRGTCPRGQKRVLKWVHEKRKSQKLKKNPTSRFHFFCKNHLSISYKKIKKIKKNKNIFFLHWVFGS